MRSLTIREVPRFFQDCVIEAYTVALQKIAEAQSETEQVVAWKLFLLVPRMLLTRTAKKGGQGKAEMFERFRRFRKGEYKELIEQSRPRPRKNQKQKAEPTQEEDTESRRKACIKAVRELQELSTGRHRLTGQALARGTPEVQQEITDPTRRPQEPRTPLPPELKNFIVEKKVELNQAAAAADTSYNKLHFSIKMYTYQAASFTVHTSSA